MRFVSIFALTLFAIAPTQAQNNISWVSRALGNDANPCTLASPCRFFQRAYSQTNNYGIVKAMDAGEYGPITISKPITIDGNDVGAAIEVTSLWGIYVSVADVVEIRHLIIHAPAGCGCSGIYSNAYASIEDVSITGRPDIGVWVNGLISTIHNVNVTGALSDGMSVQNGAAFISDSSVKYSTYGILVLGDQTVTRAVIERSRLIANITGLSVTSSGFSATARVSDNVITYNTTGTAALGGGQIITFRNNAWAGNDTDGTTPFSASAK